jgi:gluconolactonase
VNRILAFPCLGLAALVAAAVVLTPASSEEKRATIGSIERNDPAFDRLIPKGAVLEKLADGFAWTEGPTWVKDGGYLLFSDIPNNRVVKWQEGKGVSDFLKPVCDIGTRTDLMEPGTNGLAVDAEGRLVMCEHGGRQVSRLDLATKKRTVLASKYMGTRLNSPNDLTFAKNGDIYFTDPPYGLMLKGKFGEFPGQELDFQGVYRISAKDGKLTLLTKEMSKPNGIALSPDGKTLYVANSDPAKAIWMKFPVRDDGTLGDGKVFFDTTEHVKAMKPGLPDGMKVDKDGNIFATAPGGVWVFDAEGKQLGKIVTGLKTGNCCFGDDGSVLYVMCDKAIGRIKTATKGLGF